jgi:predicted CxxxxCH...CXXCH cytochrome family protein
VHRLSLISRAIGPALGVVLLAGCYQAYDSPAPLGVGCSGCHGTVESQGAPPPGLFGVGTKSTDPGVGAHAVHQHPKLSAPVTCPTCHRVPTSVDDPGHIDSSPSAEVTFGALAVAAGRQPVWTSASQTCASVYCHALDGAGDASPVWNSAQPRVCGSCHGLPPARGRTGTHPPAALAECHNCHPAVVSGTGEIIAPARHADGKVDFN